MRRSDNLSVEITGNEADGYYATLFDGDKKLDWRREQDRGWAKTEAKRLLWRERQRRGEQYRKTIR